MPLTQYGVAIGTLTRFYRDAPDSFGRWYHGHVEIATPAGIWTSALDVDTPFGLGVHYRVSRRVNRDVLGPATSMSSGFHLLSPDPNSGAVDYLRSRFLQDFLVFYRRPATFGLPHKLQPLPPTLVVGPPTFPPREPSFPGSIRAGALQFIGQMSDWLPDWLRIRLRPWVSSNGNNALSALEAELLTGRKVYLFGERYTSGNGVHDVHQNQGDPAGSQWWAQNGVWQDGAVAVERADGSVFFWQVRFDSQAHMTDDLGHPA